MKTRITLGIIFGISLIVVVAINRNARSNDRSVPKAEVINFQKFVHLAANLVYMKHLMTADGQLPELGFCDPRTSRQQIGDRISTVDDKTQENIFHIHQQQQMDAMTSATKLQKDHPGKSISVKYSNWMSPMGDAFVRALNQVASPWLKSKGVTQDELDHEKPDSDLRKEYAAFINAHQDDVEKVWAGILETEKDWNFFEEFADYFKTTEPDSPLRAHIVQGGTAYNFALNFTCSDCREEFEALRVKQVSQDSESKAQRIP